MDISLTRRTLLKLASAAGLLPRLDLGGNRITWLGFSTFRIETADGRVFLVDPWLSFEGCPLKAAEVKRLDGILITHGHWQHIGEAVELAKATRAPVLAVEEVATHLKGLGVVNAPQANIGATLGFAGIQVSLTPAVHTSGILDKESGFVGYGGHAVGFVLHLPRGLRVYHAGDTDVFGDMALIRERWSPQLALLPIGDTTTMGPSGAALACRLLGVKAAVPMHYDQAMFTGRPDDFERELSLRGVETRVIRAKVGEPISS